MPSTYLTEKQYFNLVAAIAYMHDCRVVSLNYSERTITLVGPPKSVHTCSLELEALLGR